MGYKQNGGVGTLVIDRRIRGVGRIKRASGTTDPAQYKRYEAMMDNLEDQARLDVLNSIKAGTLSLAEVYQYWKAQELSRLPTVQHIIGLNPRLYEWVESYGIKPTTRRNYKVCFKSLLKVNPKGVETDLPQMMKDYRNDCMQKGITRHFNQTRAAVLSYLSDQYNKYHPLYLSVAATKTIPVSLRKLGKAHRVNSIIGLLGKMENPKAKAIFWTLCLTGMGYHEYCGDWEVKEGMVYIHGTKRQSRDRVIPLIYPLPPRETLDASWFRQCLRVADKELQIYDGRRTFAHWCESAGIPRVRMKLYMGHIMTNVTDLYLYVDTKDYAVEDGARLRAYIEEEQRVLQESLKAERVKDKLNEFLEV